MESILGSTEIYHRRGAEADVINICTCISYTLEKIIMYLVRRDSAIPSYQDLVCLEQFWQKIAYLIGSVLVEIHIVDSANVISVKSSHVYFILVL